MVSLAQGFLLSGDARDPCAGEAAADALAAVVAAKLGELEAALWALSAPATSRRRGLRRCESARREPKVTAMATALAAAAA